MINNLKKELIEYGTAELPKYAPNVLDIREESDVDALLNGYTSKWVALHNLLRAKTKEILKRKGLNFLERTDLQDEYELAIAAIRNKFTTAYPLNL